MNKSILNFDAIRKKLDPAFSYIIFERHEDSDPVGDLTALLGRLGIPALETRVHRNKVTGACILVAKLDPAKADDISREYVSVNLPDNVSYLFYDSLIRSGKR
jgi:hypothetical protein